MRISFVPLFVAALVVGLLLGLGTGAAGGSWLWPDPPCPACPVVVCPEPTPAPTSTPESCPEGSGARGGPFPHVKEQVTCEDAESAYYRGFVASCVYIGIKQDVDKDLVSATCGLFMANAYEADFFTELKPDDWVWPPITDTPAPTPAKKSDAAP